jgi:C4-dicarboxylate-specific signal transduction histidine kinase
MGPSADESLKVLVVDDEPGICRLLQEVLGEFHHVQTVQSSDQALKLLPEFKPELVISDIRMPGKDGIALLSEIKGTFPETLVAMLTGQGERELIKKALRLGAFDYLEKPCTDEALLATAHRAKETVQLRKEVTQLKNLQLQAERLSFLGEFAAGVAHEIGNPLATLFTHLNLLQTLFDQPTPEIAKIKNLFAKMDGITKRVSDIVKVMIGLTDPSKAQQSSKTTVSQLVRNTLNLCEERLKSKGIQVQVGTIDDRLTFECVVPLISQVLYQLLHTAALAIQDLPEKWIRIEAKEDPNTQWIWLSVSHSGARLPPEVAKNMFEPFFAAQSLQGGSSPGLSYAHHIVQDHCGSIFVDTESPNPCFKIRLPKARLSHITPDSVKKVA